MVTVRVTLTETDVELRDGRTLRAYEACPEGSESGLAVVWHHGTPNVGTPPEPLFAASARHGIRWISYDRPGYGGSTPHPGRDVGSAAADVAAVADALGVDRFAVMGSSGGGPHALACAALLPERVQAVVCAAGLAPFDAPGLDWFAGMAPAGAAELRAAVRGREALEKLLAASEFDPEIFTPADHAALGAAWRWLATVAGEALRGGIGGMVDDDLAYVAPWGFDPARVTTPTLVLHGDRDRVVPSGHGAWLARNCGPAAELWARPDDGHISVLNSSEQALAWLRRVTG
ncbi:alpha/beta fold hydrolase [Kitasatospora mediocidica]|uniref:alpha/beta fold hydrolase n=1 Tax=Kitasatospora mediocidica TaxID=58352 RepID=UPI000566FB99|nr:alpha/beta hydrolase [Kitasatospora mediocidica]